MIADEVPLSQGQADGNLRSVWYLLPFHHFSANSALTRGPAV
jgi:hypothetical protein